MDKPRGQAFKTIFIKTSPQVPCGSLLLVGERLFLQLLPPLLPHPFVFIQYNRRFGAGLCPQFPYHKALSPLVLEKKVQEIINSYYSEEM